MREVPIATIGDIDAKLRDALASELRTQRTLGDVLAWGRRHDPPRTVAEIITQDEYTHDVILGAEPSYLVFDTT